MARYVIGFEDLHRADVALVGGKNSSLGEMVQELAGQGIAVPGGFATTSDAFRAFLKANGLEAMIAETVDRWQAGKITLAEAGSSIRAAIVSGDWPEEIRADILSSYAALSETAAAEGIDFDLESRGIMHFYSEQADLAHARNVNRSFIDYPTVSSVFANIGFHVHFEKN